MIGEIDRLDKLVLDRLESDAQELNQGKFDSSELLKQTAQKCEIILPEQGSRLCLLCEANLAYVCANRRGVEQIMTNFLSNAIKKSTRE